MYSLLFTIFRIGFLQFNLITLFICQRQKENRHWFPLFFCCLFRVPSLKSNFKQFSVHFVVHGRRLNLNRIYLFIFSLVFPMHFTLCSFIHCKLETAWSNNNSNKIRSRVKEKGTKVGVQWVGETAFTHFWRRDLEHESRGGISRLLNSVVCVCVYVYLI